MPMLDLIYFILCAFGCTQILVYSDLIPRPKTGWLAKFMRCPMCLGFHVGWILMFVPTDLFIYEVSPSNGFMLGFISSGTSYLLNMVMSDEGININMGS
jgi:hypothetical protein